MKRIILLSAVLLLGGVVLAQNGAAPPPSDYGIGNQTLSPNSNVGSSPSMSPDQNQAITDTRGSTTGDNRARDHNPGTAGSAYPQNHSTALGQGTTATSESTSATAERRLPRKPAKGKAATNTAHRKRAGKKKAQQTYLTPIPPDQGPSTTEAPGPNTGVKAKHKTPQGGNGNYSGTSPKSSGPQ